MKTECSSRLPLFNPRILIRFALYAAGLVLALAPMSSAAQAANAAAEMSQSVPAQAPGKWIITDSMATAREVHTATLLPNGQVLVAGGIGNGFPIPFLASAELYDPTTRMWTATGSLAAGREAHTATLLPNGYVLVAGGIDNGSILASAELYRPGTGVWRAPAA